MTDGMVCLCNARQLNSVPYFALLCLAVLGKGSSCRAAGMALDNSGTPNHAAPFGTLAREYLCTHEP